jgi:cytochrome c553
MRIFAFLIVSLMVFPAIAGDPDAGKAKAGICGACHGANGISPNDIWPNLAGQKEGYIIKQVKAFQAGVRIDPTMAPMVAPLSQQDIEDIAAYYSKM